MTLIEGIGDEVTQFFMVIAAIAVVVIAWWTTNTSERGTYRTVLLLERAPRRNRASRGILLTNHTEATTIAEGDPTREVLLTNHTETVTIAPGTSPVNTATFHEPEEATSNSSGSTPTPSTSSDRTDISEDFEEEETFRIVQVMDADTSSHVRNRRMAFYNRPRDVVAGNDVVNNAENQTASENSTNENIQNRVQESANQENQNNEFSSQNTPSNPIPTPTENHPDSITIKLKYLNDDLKLVDGRLQEPLGDFKKRHFQNEISANKLVRLIFNGHVLQQDTQTLQNCGLFDNCVVHCLIHQRRGQTQEESNSNQSFSDIRNEFTQNRMHFNNNNNNLIREWDLGNFLFAILSCFLGTAWYLRYVYSHLYTITATIGLILMTSLFAVIVLGMHFSDVDLQQRQRAENAEPQPTHS